MTTIPFTALGDAIERLVGMSREIGAVLSPRVERVYRTYAPDYTDYPFFRLYPGVVRLSRAATGQATLACSVSHELVLGRYGDGTAESLPAAQWIALPTLALYFEQHRTLIYDGDMSRPSQLDITRTQVEQITPREGLPILPSGEIGFLWTWTLPFHVMLNNAEYQ